MNQSPLRIIIHGTLLLVLATTLAAQDREVGSAAPVFVDSTKYATLVAGNSSSLRCGWNWGLPLSRFSDALHARTMHYGYAWPWVSNGTLTSMGRRFRDSTTESTTDTVFLFPHVQTHGITKTGNYGKEEFKCLRYDPEITVQKTGFSASTTASPGATFGFRYKDANIGVSGTRVTLHDGDFPANSTTLVLADVWPDSAMMTRWLSLKDLNANDPGHDQSGHHLLLSVNLRRSGGAPITQDTMPAVMLRLKYTTFGGDSGYVKFNQFPNPANLQPMNPNDPSYGFRYAEADSNNAGPDRDFFIIRRHHLPASTDNINLSALASFPVEPHFGDDNPVLRKLYGSNEASTIERLDVEVSYITHASSSDNLDLEIDWVKLETPDARNFLSGQDSALFVTEHIAFLRQLDTLNAITRRIYRVASWYTKDEAYMMYWEGWRQYNRLMDSLAVTEVNLGSVPHMLYKTGTRRLWQGLTPKFMKETSVPYYERGISYARDPGDTRFDYLGYSRGTEQIMWDDVLVHETTGTHDYLIDYETWWGTKPVDATHYSVELPMPESQYNGSVVHGSEMQPVTWQSPQSALEGVYYKYALEPEFLFLGAEIPWYANLWPNSEWIKHDDEESIHVNTFRPCTGSEVYAMAYGQLILGAKGLITYYGVSNDNTTNPFLPTATGGSSTGDIIAIGATSFLNRNVEPNGTDLLLVRNDTLGTDFLLAAGVEPTQVTDFMVHAGSPTVADPGHFASKLGVEPTRLYAGRESNRLALYRVYNHINGIKGTLERLELQAWWAKGYKQWTRAKSGISIGDFLRIDSNLAVAHPSRIDSMGVMYKEDFDSVFVDVTILKHRDTAINVMFYVGIANRRTDPRVWHDAAWQFYTEAEFEDSLGALAFGEYDQKGAREIRLPFHYESPDSQAYNLHISELTPLGQAGIDTVIGSHTTLAIRLRPGQGKFFRVEPIPASQNR